VPITDGSDVCAARAGAANAGAGAMAKLFRPVKRRRLVSENSFNRFKVGVWSV